jgi:hypothetical protein
MTATIMRLFYSKFTEPILDNIKSASLGDTYAGLTNTRFGIAIHQAKDLTDDRLNAPDSLADLNAYGNGDWCHSKIPGKSR